VSRDQKGEALSDDEQGSAISGRICRKILVNLGVCSACFSSIVDGSGRAGRFSEDLADGGGIDEEELRREVFRCARLLLYDLCLFC
jgi:hypothetical protein